MAGDISKMTRLMKLVALLRKNSYPNHRKLERALKNLDVTATYSISQKTIQRDVQYLRDVYRAPIAFDNGKRGYYLTNPSWKFEVPQLEEEEMRAVTLGARLAETIMPEPVSSQIQDAASRLTDYYYRPTIVLTRANDLITGSARSIKNFDIYDAIDHCSDLLEHFGGHKYAAGLSMRPENVDEFRRRFEAYIREHLTVEELVPELEVDLKINFRNITSKFMRILTQFAPFGPGNTAPVFWSDNIIDAGGSRPVGGHKHLKLTVRQLGDDERNVFSGIAFQKGDLFARIHSGEPFSICYNLEYNYWQGKTTLQLNVKDIKFKENF